MLRNGYKYPGVPLLFFLVKKSLSMVKLYCLDFSGISILCITGCHICCHRQRAVSIKAQDSWSLDARRPDLEE